MCKIFYADSEEELRAFRHLRKPETIKQMIYISDVVSSNVYGYIEKCLKTDSKLVKQFSLHVSGRKIYQGWNSPDNWDKIKWFLIGPEWKTTKAGDPFPMTIVDHKRPICECLRWFWSQMRVTPVEGMFPSFAVMFLDNPYYLPICLYGYPRKIIVRKMEDGNKDFLLRQYFFFTMSI